MRSSLLYLALVLSALLFVPGLGRPAQAAAADCNIWWAQVLHDTFNSDYRAPGGPVVPGSTVRLRLRTAQSDLTGVRVRVWDDRTNTESYYPMSWDGSFDHDPVTYDWWVLDLPVGSQPTILYYFFELNDAPGWCSADQDFYVDDDPQFLGGGPGKMVDNYVDWSSFQITVYDPAFASPEWMKRGVTYQIFPDRFRDGQPANNPAAGQFFYGGNTTIVRSGSGNNPAGAWNFPLCDPRSTYVPSCPDRWADNFYGGDLTGIADKVEEGYFDLLGVNVLYLNPVFASPSNHKYDTADYLRIDPAFGARADFERLAGAAHDHGIKLLLDGVFNHTSSDSRYFDIYCRYDATGSLIANTAACATNNDGNGACESPSSPRRSWYYFEDQGPLSSPSYDTCYPKPPGVHYEAWYGFSSLPKLNSGLTAVRDLIFSAGLNSAAPYWTAEGADGWRLDVGGDVDCGLTCNPSNNFWEGFRSAVRDPAVTGKTDTLVLGEEWGDGSPWLLGNEWDSVMNYRFRSALLGWMFTGCSGDGCSGGTEFEDNDSNNGSSSGPIRRLTPTEFDQRLRSIAEDYPLPALQAAMNLGGSHDTNRLLFLLKKINFNSLDTAKARLDEWWTIAFAYPGSPTIYYGDEVGLCHDGVWANNKWEDDPYNRAPFPWPDATGNAYVPDLQLPVKLRQMASIRHSFRSLQDGAVHHGLIVDDTQRLYGWGRTGAGTALIVMNSDSAAHSATFSNLNQPPFSLPDGTGLADARNGVGYVVSAGAVTVDVPSRSGVILLESSRIDWPAPAGGLDLTTEENGRLLYWSPVTRDTGGGNELATRYEIHRSRRPDFVPGRMTLLDTVDPPLFGTPGGKLRFLDQTPAADPYFYIIRAINAPGRYSDSRIISPEVCDHQDNDGDGTVDDSPWPPGPVGNSLYVTKKDAQTVTLSWSAAAWASKYAVYRATEPQSLVAAPNRLLETTALTYDDTPPAGVIFYFQVTSRDDCGGETTP